VNIKQTNLTNILRLKGTVFSFKELFLASRSDKPHLLLRRLNYYVQAGQMHAIRRGLYAKDVACDRRECSTKILTPSYLSFETILVEAGVIFQHYATMFVATYKTKEIMCDGQAYSFRKIKDEILMNAAGIEDRGTYFAATKERAFLDVLYLNKDYHFDNLGPLDQAKVAELLPIYANTRMEKKLLRILRLLTLIGWHHDA